MIDYQIAKSYLDRGWAVIPVILSLDNNGKVIKKPAIPWREYQDRLPTEEELHQWFDSKQYNGIGLITGKISHVVVVDVDESKENYSYSSGMVVKTISGGRHYYYRWTEELRNDAKIDDKPLDFRGDGGFVVLPPSHLFYHNYEWIKDSGTLFLHPLPDDLRKLLKVRKDSPNISHSEVEKGSIGLPIAHAGERNMTAARVAGMICQGISKKLLPVIGFKTFQLWNKTSCYPSLDEHELQTTWNSIYHTELRNHPEIIDYSILTGDKVLTEYYRLKKEYGEGLLTGYDELDRLFTFLPDQLYLLSAPTHHGKTTFALSIAARIATFGERVLFASLEQGFFIAPRVETMIGGVFPPTLSVLTAHKMITVKGLIDAIGQMREKPKLVVIDHLHFIKKQGKGATEDIDTMILDLQNMAKELHLPVFVIAHVRKLNADRPPELDDLRDSSSLSQVPAVVMLLYRKRNTDEFIKNSYLSKEGVLIIAKNRIQGKTGVLGFSMDEGGDFRFY